MPRPKAPSTIGLVDEAIRNMACAGISVDRDDVCLLWKMAQREASAEEVDVWRKEKLSAHQLTIKDDSARAPELAAALDLATSLRSRLAHLVSNFEAATRLFDAVDNRRNEEHLSGC